MNGLQHANAFVIQFRGADEADAARLSGRVEHVASGRTALFQTVEELPQILLKMLRTVASEKEAGSDEPA
jgi:ABC-type amino acid transport substrate-binding protein